MSEENSLMQLEDHEKINQIYALTQKNTQLAQKNAHHIAILNEETGELRDYQRNTNDKIDHLMVEMGDMHMKAHLVLERVQDVSQRHRIGTS